MGGEWNECVCLRTIIINIITIIISTLLNLALVAMRSYVGSTLQFLAGRCDCLLNCLLPQNLLLVLLNLRDMKS